MQQACRIRSSQTEWALSPCGRDHGFLDLRDGVVFGQPKIERTCAAHLAMSAKGQKYIEAPRTGHRKTTGRDLKSPIAIKVQYV